ncbi:SDR family oxidoreductase [Pseudomonas citronellolis]|uniref:SDR family oxidoreductase n=1 Tax=Pseudomonas citronellolis TaxID=53408 RepID=UPI0020A0E4CC|nr:SDR family oxidoreductase [Pseudomonas citronellolis]MCP1604399.1 3-oxoacyl-[acyl-carrier protein] reductase [Pseudomonas citronellolis]MCP1655222.1 3-oxoacyl-[acyl-carrier protein] reductase [Pseudomonas citronellolis]MCP1724440.1 3-oxoacyl-[acyl-carrier protein] reductase [Pseudomonas citronellolis]UUC48567.1 SDR family oxidoreductase [Pseudomonas citronellolis]UXJ54576.1 SDR family oxidoreductase [Pseudomonas citronellolis]
MTRFDFSGRRVLVTGAAQGIGRRIAEGFAAADASLLLLDRQEQAVTALASELRSQGREARALAVDLADPPAIAAALAGLDGLDVLVHNAAYFPLTDFAAITPQLLQRTLAVNLGALFWLTQAALPLFAARGGGCVLATSSVTGNRVAYPGLSHYAASKAGVNGFIRNAALELAPRNIRVNGVEPGMIHTPAMANLGDAALEARIAAGIPLGRLGQPADIAGAMLFLASDAAAYITGQTLVVDGGATLPESSAALA